jgi:DNA-binding response OmpR family regulator
MTVLVVDDEPRIARFVVRGLQAAGYAAVWAPTAAAALERVAHGVDLVILDLGLPDMDGLDVLRAMRNTGMTTPVFVLSSSRDDRGRGLSCGADEYFVKPTPMPALLARVRESLG